MLEILKQIGRCTFVIRSMASTTIIRIVSMVVIMENLVVYRTVGFWNSMVRFGKGPAPNYTIIAIYLMLLIVSMLRIAS